MYVCRARLHVGCMLCVIACCMYVVSVCLCCVGCECYTLACMILCHCVELYVTLYTPYFFSPSSSDTYMVQLQKGDTLLLATDGLWDNVHIEDILSLIPPPMSLSENNLSVWDILI